MALHRGYGRVTSLGDTRESPEDPALQGSGRLKSESPMNLGGRSG